MDEQAASGGRQHAAAARPRPVEEGLSSDDYTTSVVPAAERRPDWRMFLTFVSLQAAFPTLYVGYVARSEGVSFGQLMLALAIASVTMIGYCIGSANLGAVTGQTHTLITRTVFGRWGSVIVSLMLIVVSLGFYTFKATFLTARLGGLFTIGNTAIAGFAFCVIMMAVPLFGFRGLAGFAGLVAAPVALAWVGYALVKIVISHQGHDLLAAPAAVRAGVPAASVLVVTGLIVGGNTWGNEPDLFRYARTSPRWNIPTVAGGYVVGGFVFPVTGYLYAVVSGTTGFGATMRFFASSTLFGLTALAALFFGIQAFASNAGNLYHGVNASQNLIGGLRSWRRAYTVGVLGLGAALLSLVFTNLARDFFVVAGISAVTIPSATTIMVVDRFVLPRLTGRRRPSEAVTPWERTARANWPGIAGLLTATVVGGVTGGLIPGLAGFGRAIHGFPALQAWLSGSVVYLALALLASRSGRYATLLGYPLEPGRLSGPA